MGYVWDLGKDLGPRGGWLPHTAQLLSPPGCSLQGLLHGVNSFRLFSEHCNNHPVPRGGDRSLLSVTGALSSGS